MRKIMLSLGDSTLPDKTSTQDLKKTQHKSIQWNCFVVILKDIDADIFPLFLCNWFYVKHS